MWKYTVMFPFRDSKQKIWKKSNLYIRYIRKCYNAHYTKIKLYLCKTLTILWQIAWGMEIFYNILTKSVNKGSLWLNWWDISTTDVWGIYNWYTIKVGLVGVRLLKPPSIPTSGVWSIITFLESQKTVHKCPRL